MSLLSSSSLSLSWLSCRSQQHWHYQNLRHRHCCHYQSNYCHRSGHSHCIHCCCSHYCCLTITHNIICLLLWQTFSILLQVHCRHEAEVPVNEKIIACASSIRCRRSCEVSRDGSPWTSVPSEDHTLQLDIRSFRDQVSSLILLCQWPESNLTIHCKQFKNVLAIIVMLTMKIYFQMQWIYYKICIIPVDGVPTLLTKCATDRK